MVGEVETKRFAVDPATAGLWEQVLGDLHGRLRDSPTNGRALEVLAKVYFDLARRDPSALARSIDRVILEERGYRP